MSFLKRLLSGGSSKPPAEETQPLYLRPRVEPASPPPPPTPTPPTPSAAPVSTLSAEDQQRIKTFMASLQTELGGPDSLPEDFKAFVIGAKPKMGADAFKRALLNHPDFAEVYDHAVYALDFETWSDDRKMPTRLTGTGIHAKERWAYLDENPAEVLSFDDLRPRAAFDQGIDLRWQCHYRRPAGSLSDQERLLYVVGLGMLDTKAATREEASEMIVSALWGDGRGDAQWTIDSNYGGDNATKFLEGAKEHYSPLPVQRSYDLLVSMMVDLGNKAPNHALAQFTLPIIHGGGNRWATAR